MESKLAGACMKTNIDLKLYATLKKFSPASAENYPIPAGMTVRSLIDLLGIPPEQAKLVFIDGIRAELETRLNGGERVGIFPPVGGG